MASPQQKDQVDRSVQGPSAKPQQPLEPARPFYEPDSMAKLPGEGPVHIVRTGSEGRWHFSVTWTPYDFSGGALPARPFEEEAALQSFLRKELDIEDDDVRKAMNDLASFGRASIRKVQLRPKKARQLGLAEPKGKESR